MLKLEVHCELHLVLVIVAVDTHEYRNTKGDARQVLN